MVESMDATDAFGESLPSDQLPPGESFGTRLGRRDGVVWLALGGELDMLTAPRLRAVLRELTLAPDEALVLDLRGLAFLDSSGLAVILGAHERAATDGGPPTRILIRGSAPVEALFATIGAADYLHLLEDPAEVVGSHR